MKFKKPKFTKFDYFTIIAFTVGFVFSAADMSILKGVQNFLNLLSPAFFWGFYFVLFFILIINLKQIINNNDFFRIRENTNNKALKGIIVFLAGYFLGFLVNVENAYILIIFNNIPILTGS